MFADFPGLGHLQIPGHTHPGQAHTVHDAVQPTENHGVWEKRFSKERGSDARKGQVIRRENKTKPTKQKANPGVYYIKIENVWKVVLT